MTAKQSKKQELDLLQAVEKIVELAKDSQLSKDFFRKAGKYIKYLSEALDLTKEQSVMMSLFIDNSEDSSISISDFGTFLGCRTTRIIRFMNDIDVLEKRGLIICCRDRRGRSYRVPMKVIEAFQHNELYKPDDLSGLSCAELFAELEDIFDMRKNDELTEKGVCEKIRELFTNNPNLIFVEKLKSFNFDVEDELLLILFSHLFVNNSDDNIGYHDLDFLFDKRRWNRIKSSLNAGEHILLSAKMIEYNNDDGFVNRESFRMTMEAKRTLFEELNLSSLNTNQKKAGLLKADDIAIKKLYYDEEVRKQVSELTQLLNDDHYQEIRNRLKESGFRCGFTCLFYGMPGTGKTETVLQLAKETGRDIMQVNISEIKSMWVGESEKNIKALFDNYRNKVRESKLTPVLLFNEADAIIGKRQEGAERAVDKMENSIQNIILQEMETLDGILIATTNLAQNMDKAFERRFLYKIKFTKPTIEARMSIWREMIPTLSEADTHALAVKYDFSGGQIENIARHYAIDNILHGSSSNVLETLSIHCDNERLEKKEQRKIGF
ncbi:ATP-binding protein [Prevotella sp. E2-28]|uniref:ATP-binding protein n=1 Tax=Prevotella sp. E2-28 TaxID=2913620 RepID=UPI001EDB312A|nr:ATP-binding protein [Prevotella sp. E2-28]UKK55122.1 ATP-binding protein [Prevotella sp. E2-28]